MDTIGEQKEGVSPQIEDGHIKIANEIAEALAKRNFSAYEIRILWVIWRKTYGWHKKEDQISFTQFEKATGLHRRHVQRTLKRLMERNIVASTGYSTVASTGYSKILSYQFQKDYTKWKDVASKGCVASTGPDRSLQRLTQKHLTKALKNGRSKKETDPRVKDFFNFWKDAYQGKTGQPYSFTYEVEGKLIKQLLKGRSLDILQDLGRKFFRDQQVKEKVQQGKIGYTIGAFKIDVNRLVSSNAMDPLEEAKRELRKDARIYTLNK